MTPTAEEPAFKCISAQDAEKHISNRKYDAVFADCIIQTNESEYILQYRPPNFKRVSDVICLFGGHVEHDELPKNAVRREIAEELNLKTASDQYMYHGALEEIEGKDCNLIHIYALKNIAKSGLKCDEGEIVIFRSITDILDNDKVMPYTKYILKNMNAVA